MEYFKFRLQKLLDIRVEKENKCIIDFKEAQVAKETVIIKLENLQSECKKYENFNKEDSVISRKIQLNYLNAVNASIEDTNIELTSKNENLEKKREILTEKRLERKTVAILKEKQQEAFIKEQNLIEQKSNDEFALYSFIRRRERG